MDTNVISEMMRFRPSPQVVQWIETFPSSAFAVTAITAAEIFAGIEVLPHGKRRTELTEAAEGVLIEDLQSRILPFDFEAARLFAVISAGRRAKGRPISQYDAQIAAIVQSHGATLATRNIPDFAHCGIELIDPWTVRSH